MYVMGQLPVDSSATGSSEAPTSSHWILTLFHPPLTPSAGFNVGRSAGGRSTLREINRDACHFPGFPVLQTLLPKHTNVPELYFLLMALFLQQPVNMLPDSLQVHVSTPNSFSSIRVGQS